MIVTTILVLAILAFVGKLIYDVQQKKTKPTQTNEEFPLKDDFQKLAGIKPIDENDALRQILVNANKPNGHVGSDLPSNLLTKKLNEKIVEQLQKEFENSEFPPADPSINVRTSKIYTIDKNFGESDPLASVPMSRVSKEAKQKMAEIAKQDIASKLEENTANLPQSIKTTLENELNEMNAIVTGQTPPQNKCGCGRSETGFCTGLHMIPKKDWAAGVREIPAPKPKRKYTKKPKA